MSLEDEHDAAILRIVMTADVLTPEQFTQGAHLVRDKNRAIWRERREALVWNPSKWLFVRRSTVERGDER